MKKSTFFSKFIVAQILGLIFTTALFAGNINVVDNGSTKLKVNENSYAVLSLANNVADIEHMLVKTNSGNFTLLTIKDYGRSVVAGDPGLPVIKKLIEVPLNATYEIEIIEQGYTILNLADYGLSEFILPAQPPLSKNIDNPEDVEFIYNQASYMVNDFVGPDMVNIQDLGISRGVRLARVEIAPISYNPVQNKIKVYHNLVIRINFKGGDINATVIEKENKFSPYYEGIYQQLINYKTIDGKELIMDEPVTYIIVSDPMFENALQPFIEWKTKKGFQVVEAYTDDPLVGTSTTSIKSYLEDFYNNPPTGYNSQSFVLIVGDVNQVPTFNGTAGSHVSDLYYHEYTGDLFPECYYGRFSANNLSELQPQIDKTLEYEQYLFPDPSFLDEVVMVAGHDDNHITWSNGQINYGTTHYFNAAHGIYSHTYLQPEPGGSNYSQEIRDNINDGVTFGNYTAHCSTNGWGNPSFTISHIPQMTNASKYPLLIGNCCSSSEFQTTCFGEEILRAADKGAIGYIGGSNSTYWDEDYWFGVGFETVVLNAPYNADNLGAYDRTFHDHGEPLEEWYVTQGQMTPAGNLAVTQSGSAKETYYWEIYHLMGDPSLMIYFSQPPETTANYQDLMPLASTSFAVNTDPYAYVAISKDGILHGVAIADATGLADVTMFDPIVVPGEADVVITGQNLKPFTGTVTVASPTGAYVLLDEIEIDDSNGNSNGLADFSEYIMLDVTLENLGSSTATNLVATISTTDTYCTIDNNSYNWPDINAGNTSMQTGAFAFTVADVVPDQHIAAFDMEVTDGVDTWNSTFNVTFNSPVLTIGSYSIDDAAGNNNGRLDPGETVNILISNSNEGGCDAINTIASMVSSNPLITVNNATYDLETIASGETKDAVFNITVDAAAQIGEVVEVNYMVESVPYSASSILTFAIGLIVEDFETGDFSAYEWEFEGNAEWVIDSSDPYEGDYSAKSGSISDNQTTSLTITLEVANDDEISFYYKVSSESTYDYLKFYIDNTMKDEWSGEVSWSLASYDITDGNHTLKWEYSKDYSVSSGSDCGWVDYIEFPAFGGLSPLAVVASGNPAEICFGETSQLNAYAMGGSGNYTYDWMPVATLSDPTIANPIASPTETTTYYVVVDDGDVTVTDDVTIVVNEIPEKPEITQAGNTLISSAVSGNQWYDSNGIITGATSQSYSPTVTDDYYVIVTNSYGCVSEPSDPYYFIYTGLIELADGQRINIYPNPFNDQFTVDYSLASVSKVKISIYNTFGQLITIVEDEAAKSTGSHRIQFNAGNFDSGIYYLKIETTDYSVIRRIIHSK
ncbi:MAG: T9SS type A sorting domain-containing protein [Bacteroidales bacterium]|nr:T9SS type A sorting domain-containing protein [Bacteroidales bacterium]